MFTLQGKTAIVTGGGSGIGKAIATSFAANGAHVHLIDLNRDAAESIAADIQRDGGKATAWAGDVTDTRQVQDIIKRITDASPRIDILVNSAGIAHIGNLEHTNDDDIDRVFRVNVKGTFHAMQAVIGPMKKQGGGCILNIASVAGSMGIPERFAYAMSKGAVLAMTLSVARDYVKDNIRCNAISPARIHTSFVDGFLKNNYPGREKEMFEKLSVTQPIGRMGTPEEVASLALYLCSDPAAFITGCDYPIDGGFTKLNTG